MRLRAVPLVFFLGTAAVLSSACGRVEPVRADATFPPAAVPPTAGKREIRATGTIQAVRAFTVQVPQIAGQTVQSGPNTRPAHAREACTERDKGQARGTSLRSSTVRLNSTRRSKPKRSTKTFRIR